MSFIHEDEKIILFKKRHWLPIAGHAIMLVIFSALPFIVLASFSFAPEDIRAVRDAYAFPLLFLCFVFAFLAWMMWCVRYTNYALDTLIVTTERIIDIEQRGLFSRDTAELSYSAIEDIRVDISGILPSLFGFGMLYVQTAGESREFMLKDIPNPHEAKDAIFAQLRNLSKEAK